MSNQGSLMTGNGPASPTGWMLAIVVQLIPIVIVLGFIAVSISRLTEHTQLSEAHAVAMAEIPDAGSGIETRNQ